MNSDTLRLSTGRMRWMIFLVICGTAFIAGCGSGSPEPAPEVQLIEQQELNDQLQMLGQQES